MATNLAPMMAHNLNEPMYEATARAAAKAGMSVSDWIKYTNQIEKGAKHLRIVDREMRAPSLYRNAA